MRPMASALASSLMGATPGSGGSRASRAWAAASRNASCPGAATSCTPTGSPSDMPAYRLIAGMPSRLQAMQFSDSAIR